MERTSAGLLLGWALVLASPPLGLLNLYAQWQSCRLDWQLSNAPPDAGGWSDGRRPVSIGCDTAYGLLDGSTVVVPPPFDWTFVLLAALAVGIALIVECIRARREPAASIAAEASSPRP